LEISFIVPILIQTNGTVRAKQIADPALYTLFLIPHRFVVAPVLIGAKIFGNGKFYHRYPILDARSVKR
jgi:hypothetical protein